MLGIRYGRPKSESFNYCMKEIQEILGTLYFRYSLTERSKSLGASHDVIKALVVITIR